MAVSKLSGAECFRDNRVSSHVDVDDLPLVASRSAAVVIKTITTCKGANGNIFNHRNLTSSVIRRCYHIHNK